MWRTSSYWYVDIFFWLNRGRLLLFHIKWRGLHHPWEILLMDRLRCVQCCQTYVVKYDDEFPKSAVMYLVGVLVVIYVASGQNGTISLFTENIYQSTTVSEICKDLPLFEYSSLGNLSFPWYLSSINSSTMEKFWNFFMVLEFHQKFSGKFESYFFKELEFMELKLHGKVKFHKLEFQKRGRLLNISQTMVYCKYFAKG